MKRNQVDALFLAQTKRKKTIFQYILIIILLSILAVILLLVYINKNKNYYVSYNEDSDLDYQVYLKSNDFYKENHLEKDNKYIVSLIDYISADFNYKLSMDEKDINYNYSYKIDATVSVKEENTNYMIYTFTDNLLSVDNKTSNSNYDVNINEQLKIDYNYYNNIISRFTEIYELDGAESTLDIKMYVNVTGSCDDFTEDSDKQSVISLSIPLDETIISMDINDGLADAEDNVMACKKDGTFSIIFLFASMMLVGVVVYLGVKLVKYMIQTRTARSMYEKELKKILSNYRCYIQKINNDFDLKKYQVLKVDTFTDMLEIRETIQEPILMVGGNEKQATYFLIPSKTKLLYLYGLNVSDFKDQIQK